MTENKTDFDIAKGVYGLLTGLEKDRQARVLRWVVEELGLQLETKHLLKSETHKEDLPSAILGGSPQVNSGKTPQATDIKSFIESKSPKNDIQFAVLTAYYHQFIASDGNKKDTIGFADLKDAARLSSRAIPSRPTLNNAKNAGYINAAGHGAYKINTVGENLVLM